MPLDDACLLRFARARKLDARKAQNQLQATLAWREMFGVDSLSVRLSPAHHASTVTLRCSLLGRGPLPRTLTARLAAAARVLADDRAGVRGPQGLVGRP
jgi:hypothetical protein